MVSVKDKTNSKFEIYRDLIRDSKQGNIRIAFEINGQLFNIRGYLATVRLCI